MKFIKLDLLTLLISLFLFASCESTSTIGLEVDPNAALQGDLIDTLTIGSRTQLEDAANTRSVIRHPLGYIKDPIFGTTESSLAMVVNVPQNVITDFGLTPVLDSAILVLNYSSEFYGDSTSTYSIDVHQLSDDITQNESFLNNKIYNFSSTVIGNKTGRLYPTTRYKVTDVVLGKADTLRTVTPQLRIPLNRTFIQNNIVNLSADNLKLNETFVSLFKGLKVQVNKANSTGNGGIMFFDFAGSNSSIALYYKKQNATTTTAVDTVSVNFPIANSLNPIAATIKHDYTGTAIATQLANPNTQYATTFLQPLAGLKNKISFPYLRKFASDLGKVVINKAELVIDLSSGSDAIPYGPAPRLALYRYDIADQRQNLPDNNPGSQTAAGDPRAVSPQVFGGYYNSVTRQYIFVVTAYLQDLMDGKTQDYGTFLAPTPINEFSIFPSVSTGARSVIGSFKKNPTAGDNAMKLNIYYTKIN